MENLIRNFVNYLFDFGIINVNSVKDFLSIYDRFQGKNLKLNELFPTLLFEYFVNLNELNLQKICQEISSKFILNKKTEKEKSLIQMAKIYKKIIEKNKEKYFFLLKNHISDNYLKKSTSLSSFKKQKSPVSKKSDQFSDSQYGQLKDDFKNCTFHPKINEKSQYNNLADYSDTFSRLYNDSVRRKKSTEAKKVIKDNLESKVLTFSPQINTCYNDGINSLKDRNFLNRIEEYHKINNNKISKIVQEHDNKIKDECTFNPKILKTNSIVAKKSVSIRLYEDNTRRLKDRKIKENDPLLYKSLSSERINKSVNYKKLNNLYQDHQLKSKRMLDLKKSIDKEQGVTFKPDIKLKPSIEIKGNFAQRNSQLIDIKRMYSSETVKNSQPSMSPIESQRIKNEVIERLYDRDIDKFIRRKGSIVTDEKKFDYQNELRVDSYLNNDHQNFNSPKRKLYSIKKKEYSPKSKSNTDKSIDNNSSSNRHKNSSHFTFKKPTSRRSINTNNNYLFDEETNYNFGKELLESKHQYSKKIKHNLIKEQSEFREQEYADSLRQYNESSGKDQNQIIDDNR